MAHFVQLDANNIVNQITRILKNYSEYDIIRYNGKKAVEEYDWVYWANVLKKYMLLDI